MQLSRGLFLELLHIKDVIVMKIQILGTGCPKCNKLAENANSAAEELGIDFELIKIKNINEIMAFGVMLTPALAVDDVVKFSGKVASVADIMAVLK